MSFCIVGGGVAGTLVCLELIKQGILPHKITIIDPFLDGGSLGRRWGAIFSNTRYDQITEVLKDYSSTEKLLTELTAKYQPENRVVLSDLGWLMKESLQPYCGDLNLWVDTCKQIEETPTGWRVISSKNNQIFKTVFVCQGGIEKTLDFGKPSLSLEIALDSARLARMVRQNQTVAVFGLAHSGTLIVNHLLDIGCKVYGIYNQATPFRFERDGHYDGIKQESAEIAEKLLSTPPAQLELIAYKDTPKVIKALTKAHWVVSSIGFQTSPIRIQNLSGDPISYENYSPETGELHTSLFGFGLAYPGVTTLQGQTYKDVSIPSFVSQIRRCLPTILTKS